MSIPFQRLKCFLPGATGAICGVLFSLGRLSHLSLVGLSRTTVWLELALAAAVGAGLFLIAQRLFATRLLPFLPAAARDRVGRAHPFSYAMFLLAPVGETRVSGPLLWSGLVVAFVALHFSWVLLWGPQARSAIFSSFGWVAFLFFFSGIAALVYQVVWQRALYAVVGVNLESVTLVVTIFMFGLGLGALLGGRLCRWFPTQRAGVFMVCELLIGLFGAVSLSLIQWVGDLVVSQSLIVTALAVFGLLAIPTLLMGATLPILVAFVHEHLKQVGRSVGLLYFINTLGSALACWLTVVLLFRYGGQRSAVYFAAACNVSVFVLVGLTARARSSAVHLEAKP